MRGEAYCCSVHASDDSNLGEDRLAPRNSFFVLDLGNQPRHGYVIGSRVAESEPAYSPLLDVGFNRQDYIWRDDTPHLHTGSEEYFIVLQGRLDLLVHGCPVSVDTYQLVGVRANVPHQVVGGQAPISSFLIRIPGNRADKVSLDYLGSPLNSEDIQNGIVRINLRDPHEDYLLGACLPSTHANYSPLLDFTCVWGVEPALEWRHERLHVHRLREEYYFVLNGSLTFEVDGSTISVNAGQILGVRPGAVHKVIGGPGPVDILFVRVPGGRGDKTLLEG